MKYVLPLATLFLVAIIAVIILTRDESAPRMNLILTESGAAQDGLYMASGVRQPQKLPIGDQFNRYGGLAEDGRWLRFWDTNGRLWHYDLQENETYALGDETVRRYIGQMEGWLYLEDSDGIFRIRFDGSEYTDIFPLDSDDTSATFSPNKEWFIYKANLRQFARVKRDGTQHLLLTPADEIHHFDGWSQDGAHFYTIGTLNNINHLSQIDIVTGELEIIVLGIDRLLGEHGEWLLFEENGRLFRQHVRTRQRDLIFAYSDHYVRDAVWNDEWLYVEVLNQTSRQYQVYAMRHDGSHQTLIGSVAPYAPLLQIGSHLASTSMSDELVFISGKQLLTTPDTTTDLLVDVRESFFISERTVPSGGSQYYARFATREKPLFLAQRPAGFRVEDFVFASTEHWSALWLAMIAPALASITVITRKLLL